MGLFIRKSKGPSDKYGQFVYYVDNNGFVRQSTGPSDKYGAIVYYVGQDGFIRRASGPSDKYGAIVYYADQDGFIRRANGPSDKYGAIVYYTDADGFVRESKGPSDRCGAFLYYIELENDEKKNNSQTPSVDEKKGLLLILGLILGLIFAPVIIVLGMFGKFILGGLFKDLLTIEAFKKFRKIYSIICISWFVLAIAAIVVLSILEIGGAIPFYALVGVNVLLFILSIVFSFKILKEHEDELPTTSDDVEIQSSTDTYEGEVSYQTDDSEYSATCEEPSSAPSGQIDNLDAIKKLKELLDLGAITEAEFEAKKNELLGLKKKPVDPNKAALVWMWISFGFTVFSYLVNVIISLCSDGNLISMFKYILGGYIAGFICMGIGITGYIISLCFLLKDKKTTVPKIVSLILMVALLCVTFSPFLLHDSLEYAQNDDGTYSVVDCEYDVSSVIIPATHNGAPVTRIAENTFNGCYKLKSITIPSSITDIDDDFSGCSSISKINYLGTVDEWAQFSFNYYFNTGSWRHTSPLRYADLYINNKLLTDATISATEIAYGAFSSCESLENVILEDTVKIIKRYAFKNCSISSIVIPETVETIDSEAFLSCDSLVIFCERASEPENWFDDWKCISSNEDNYWSDAKVYATVYWAGEWEYDELGNPRPLS